MKKLLVVFALLLLAGSALAQSQLFISEYIEGTSNNKAVELYNNTDGPIDMSRVTLERYNNGSTLLGYSGVCSGVLMPGDVYVIANVAANPLILAVADDTANNVWTYYNGDDVLMVFLDGVLVDSMGQLGFDPGTNWGTDPIQTSEDTLVRKIDNCTGDTDVSDAYDPAVAFDGYAQDDFSFLGFHVTACNPVGNDDATWSNVKALYR